MDCTLCNGKPEEVKEECAFCGKREEVLLAELNEGNNTEAQFTAGNSNADTQND